MDRVGALLGHLQEADVSRLSTDRRYAQRSRAMEGIRIAPDHHARLLAFAGEGSALAGARLQLA